MEPPPDAPDNEAEDGSASALQSRGAYWPGWPVELTPDWTWSQDVHRKRAGIGQCQHRRVRIPRHVFPTNRRASPSLDVGGLVRFDRFDPRLDLVILLEQRDQLRAVGK